MNISDELNNLRSFLKNPEIIENFDDYKGEEPSRFKKVVTKKM